ncbi:MULTISPECIES: DUF7262 family protein [Salinibaculum]|uniref:DUF7262 family protein n=1 Tax=Salinibaculum TaxID=2732368 RepID=UPI0030D55C02
MGRGQASITAIEAGLGVLLLLGVTVTFALGTGAPADDRTQLDAYATDALTILATEQPRHGGSTRLSELAASRGSFAREKSALERRLDRLLPPNVLFRVETAYGTAGYRLPDDVATGTATVTTRHGDVSLRVWYV